MRENRYQRKLWAIALCIAVLTAFWPAAAFAADGAPAAAKARLAAQEETAGQPAGNLLTADHVRYISPDSNGKFFPGNKLTKAKAAQMIYNLLAEKPAEKTWCKDVTESTANGTAIGTLLYLGVASADDDGYFYPTKNITEGALQAMVDKALGREPQANGSTKTITRGAAVRLINQALGRDKTDKQAILKGEKIRPFTDVTTGSTYYYDIMEASIGHVSDIAEDGTETWTSYDTESQGIKGTGWKIIDGQTYYIDTTNKVIQRNTTVNGSKLDKNGRYTTGNAKLDAELVKVFKKQTKASMTNKQKLKAVYKYVYQNCTYRADVKHKASKNCTSWDKTAAYNMYKNKKGNCYHFAAAVTYAARKCGYDAKTISGYVTYKQYKYYMQHGWTEIKMADGTKRFIDTELQYLSYTGGWGSDYFMRPYGTMNKMHHKHYYKKGAKEIKK